MTSHGIGARYNDANLTPPYRHGTISTVVVSALCLTPRYTVWMPSSSIYEALGFFFIIFGRRGMIRDWWLTHREIQRIRSPAPAKRQSDASHFLTKFR